MSLKKRTFGKLQDGEENRKPISRPSEKKDGKTEALQEKEEFNSTDGAAEITPSGINNVALYA